MLTPEEIQSREFLVSLRGYDRDEVHAFLGRVAEQLAQTEAKAAQLQQRLDRAKAQGPAPAEAPAAAPSSATTSPEPSAMFAEIGKETQRILEAAQEAGQQIQRKARQEADRDLQAARTQAAKLIAEGERRREHIEKVVSEMEQARAAMSVQLRGVGRTIEQTLKELAVDAGAATTVREAIGAEAGGGGAAPSPSPSPAPAPKPAPAATQPEAATAPAPETAKQEPEPAAEPEPAEPAPQPAADEAAGEVDEEQGAPAPPAEAENAPGAGAPVPTEEAAEEPPAAAAPVATEPAMPPDTPVPDASSSRNDPQGLRAAALSPLHPKLVRKVKRELQEIQNIALDRVRRSKGQGEVEAFLPTPDDTTGLGEGATDLLRQAWLAGVSAAGTLADRSLDEPAEAPDLAAMFREDATERVRSGLAATLKMGLSAQEGAQALSDRIGSVFSDFKGAQSEELAATHLIRAYEQGLLGAWKEGGITARRWVMGREPRCPEARCRANDQGGDVPVAQAFPSGHDVPPVHVGCTCTTVPAEDSSP